jgi:hypothetical protein
MITYKIFNNSTFHIIHYLYKLHQLKNCIYEKKYFDKARVGCLNVLSM